MYERERKGEREVYERERGVEREWGKEIDVWGGG